MKSLSCIFDNKIIVMSWKGLNSVTGPVAEGRKYFRRKYYEDKLWIEINKGSHILLLAPRRLGKSSIVKFMERNPNKFFVCVYSDIESDTSINEFYKRMCSMIAKALSKGAKTKHLIAEWKKTWKLTSLTFEGGATFDTKEVDFRERFFKMLADLSKLDEKVVLFLDEFPDVIAKIAKNHGSIEAENLLDDLRRLRSERKFKNNFVLVLLGSIGLNHVVKKLSGRIDKVNDLHRIYLKPLELNELYDFLDHLTDGASMELTQNEADYIKDKVVHLIPYYLQILLAECDDILMRANRPKLTLEDVDQAYINLLDKHDHFTDWFDRLKKYFPKKHLYLREVMSNAANPSGISIQEIYNLSVLHGTEETYKIDVDDILVADGYLTEDGGRFYFNSPLLRDWWSKRDPIRTT